MYVNGLEKIIESNRSRTPPWPNNNVPESFTPRSLLIKDSAKSPAWPKKPVISARTKMSTLVISGKIAWYLNTAYIIKDDDNPAIHPTHDLFGLILGNIFFVPHLRPKT